MVDVTGQAANVARNLRYRPAGALREFVSLVRYSLRSTTDPDPVLAADWDVLVVLDACRADLFAEVAGDGNHDVLADGTLETRTSPASSSEEWLRTVFGEADDAQLADLAYVTGNPFSDATIDASRFHSVAEVWRGAWDDDVGTIPPRPITDAAIRTWREGDPERLVVHYMQPHFPSIAGRDDRNGDGRPDGNEGADGEDSDGDGAGGDGVTLSAFGDEPMSVWDDLRFGRRSEADVWAAYRANLEYVLSEVEALRSNLAADRVVLTADHGNAFGERGVYGHTDGLDLPSLREVPWFVTSAEDTRSREPQPDEPEAAQGNGDPGDGSDDSVVEQRLEDLGYRT